jgi:hypothetical protein
MSSVGEYTKGSIRKFMVNGIDLGQSVRQIYVGASVMTPFVYVSAVVTDASRIQDALYEPGVPLEIVYTSGSGKTIIEPQNLVTLGNRAGFKLGGNRAGGSEIVFVSKSYFALQQEHTSYHQNVTADKVLQKLHKELDASASLTVTKTKGMIADQEPLHINRVRLGQGINLVRSRMTDEKYKSGAYTYYQDLEGNYFAMPIEEIFDKAQSGGPLYTQFMGGKSYINEQGAMAYNIIAHKKGGTGSEQGSDFSGDYQSTLKQTGQDKPKTGFNWSTMQYTPPSSSDFTLGDRKTPGATEWKGDKPKIPSMVNHKFNYDSSQKTSENFEHDKARQNVIASIASQGSMTINVPLEGGIEAKVGKGCGIDMPGEVGTGSYAKSSSSGSHAIIAIGHYLNTGDTGVAAYAALQVASGGKQGSIA